MEEDNRKVTFPKRPDGIPSIIPIDHAIVLLGKDDEGQIVFSTEALKEMLEIMKLEEERGTLKKGWYYHFKKIEVRRMPTTPGK